ncbi:MAG: BatD family protein [Flavobacteriaceae bacterium]|nr:BatD protein [Flavobacteriaceae bacterium]MDG2063124.1 BatD family protein [Flavobacteriaceae bacterium]|tara:strand:- start:306 stop:2081 length:1776 start_codon:yes stop_codon:yes gene_type:complete
MGKSKALLVLFFFFLGASFHLNAQVTFDAKVSKKRLGLNERLRVDFIMNENGDNFVSPAFKNFLVVSGPQQSVNRSWVNGMSSFSKTYTYFLTPKSKGTFILGQAEITINEEVYKTFPIEIEVTEAVEKPNDPNNIDYLTDENIRLVAEISNSSPFLNEGLTVVYKLYFRNPISITDVQELESPSYGDFWSSKINIGRAQVNPRGRYKGEPFNEVVWQKVVLYPQKSGKLDLEPLTLNLSLTVPSNRRDLFGRRILRQGQKTITAGRRILNVKPLPLEGQPESFSGAVGEFDFDVILSKDELKASESFQAKIKVDGKGNLNLFKLPEINVPNTLEVYEPERSEKIKTTLTGTQGSIEENYTIVPQYQGKYPIPQIQFSFFNPKMKTYKTLSSQELIVDVYEGPTSGIPSSNKIVGVSKTPLVISDSAFRFIQLDTKLNPIKTDSFWLSFRFWLLFSSAFIFLILGYLINRFIIQKSEDSISTKQRLAKKLAKKYLSSAKKAFGNQVQFYEALERALHNYLKAKLKIETSELSKAKIESLLKDKKVETDVAKKFILVFENCELARYAPGSDGSIKTDYERASRVMATIDRQL